jgi:hypothetical protein
MQKAWLCLLITAVLGITAAGAQAKENPAGGPGCTHESPRQCVDLAMEAMGDPDRLQQVKSVRLQTVVALIQKSEHS